MVIAGVVDGLETVPANPLAETTDTEVTDPDPETLAVLTITSILLVPDDGAVLKVMVVPDML